MRRSKKNSLVYTNPAADLILLRTCGIFICGASDCTRGWRSHFLGIVGHFLAKFGHYISMVSIDIIILYPSARQLNIALFVKINGLIDDVRAYRLTHEPPWRFSFKRFFEHLYV